MNTINRARLFTLLSRYCASGVALDKALVEYDREPAAIKAVAERTAALIRAGMSLDKAGLQTRLLRPWEAQLLALGAEHGRLDLALSDLGRYYEMSAAWWRKLRAKLMLPCAVLILGCLLLPLPQLIIGEFDLQSYLALNTALAVALLIAWRWLVRADGSPGFLDALLDLTPLGRLLQSYHRIQFLGALASLIEAGLPAQEAARTSLSACRSARLRTRWQPLLKSLTSGTTLADSLRRCQVLDATGFSLVDSGETSGRLVDMLRHVRDGMADELQLKLDSLAAWLPRLAYLLVILLLLHWMT